MQRIWDTVLWLQPEDGGKQFPIIQFSGDTDMVTAGWVSLTSVEKHEIVVTQMSGEEYRETATNPLEYQRVELRVNQLLNRTDLKIAWLAQVESDITGVQGSSFQEFRKAYRPPKLFYRDIFGEGAVATVASIATLEQFEDTGGSFVILDELS